MDWKKEYPTIEALSLANFTTVAAWVDNLPPPQTDVERTVRRRLQKRYEELGREETRKVAPDLADKYNDILERMRKAGIPLPPDARPM